MRYDGIHAADKRMSIASYFTVKKENVKIEKVGETDIKLLLSDVVNGSDAAFEKLRDEYAPLIARETKFAAHRISETTGTAESEIYDDIKQEAVLALYKAALRYDPDGDGQKVTFGLYAKICIHNAMVSELRRECGKKRCAARQPVLIGCKADMSSEADTSDRALSVMNVERLVSEGVSHMSKYERQVFDYFLQSKSTSEISRLTGRSYKSVSNALYRLRVKLKGLSNG